MGICAETERHRNAEAHLCLLKTMYAYIKNLEVASEALVRGCFRTSRTKARVG